MEMTLDWEGEVRCNDDVVVGSFNIGRLVVKVCTATCPDGICVLTSLLYQDFIVLTLTPPNPENSPLMEHQHAHPIRLVTDPWVDDLPSSMRE
jgi:hypothetical protein